MSELPRDLVEIRRADGTTEIATIAWVEQDGCKVAVFPDSVTLGNGDSIVIVERIEYE
jgi:hypothetical protein